MSNLRMPRYHLVDALARRYFSIKTTWEDDDKRSMLFMSEDDARQYLKEYFSDEDIDFISIEECKSIAT